MVVQDISSHFILMYNYRYVFSYMCMKYGILMCKKKFRKLSYVCGKFKFPACAERILYNNFLSHLHGLYPQPVVFLCMRALVSVWRLVPMDSLVHLLEHASHVSAHVLLKQ